MTHLDVYALILCLVAFIGLVALFGVLVAYIIRLTIRLMRTGAEDEAIKNEYETARNQGKKSRLAEKIVSITVCAVLLIVAAFSLYVNLREDVYFESVPTFKVVNSNSMAKKHAKNTYLIEEGLDNQFSRFDLLLLYRVPPEEELQLYDVVVYEIDGISVIHRIVEIEEPNDAHPGERQFRLQGDAVDTPDRPVKYSQIKGIYRGERVPFVGSFIFFLQSLPGWLCILLVVFATVAMPFLEKKLNEEKRKRLAAVNAADTADEADTNAEQKEPEEPKD